MAGPTTLSVTVLTNAGGANGGNTTATVIVVPISAGLQALDSGASSGGGQASAFNSTTQMYSGGGTGFSSVDIATRNIYRAGGFFSAGTWYSSESIQSITAS